MSKDESYSNHDKVILHIDEKVADELCLSIQNTLYKLQFGFWADVDGFRVQYDADDKQISETEAFLIRQKISYKKIYKKANLHSYVSST